MEVWKTVDAQIICIKDMKVEENRTVTVNWGTVAYVTKWTPNLGPDVGTQFAHLFFIGGRDLKTHEPYDELVDSMTGAI